MGSLSPRGHLLVTHGYYQLIAAACAPWFPAPGGLCPEGSVPSTTSPTSLGSCRLSTPRCFSSAPLGPEQGWLGGLELREGPFLLGEEGFWGGGRFLRAGED